MSTYPNSSILYEVDVDSCLYQTKCIKRKSDITELVYHPTAPDDKWKEVIVNEIIQVRDNNIEVEGFEYEELTEILEHICVS